MRQAFVADVHRFDARMWDRSFVVEEGELVTWFPVAKSHEESPRKGIMTDEQERA
jgi:hypothetical protein